MLTVSAMSSEATIDATLPNMNVITHAPMIIMIVVQATSPID